MAKLTKLKMTLIAPEGETLSFQKSSLMQGVLMEQISTDFAAEMHLDGLKPYSQSLQFIKGSVVWSVSTLTERAYEEIIVPLLSDNFQKFSLKHNETEIQINKKEIITVDTQELINRYYLGNCERRISLCFLTPTAFRQNNKYIFYPNLNLIYNSLMNRFDSFNQDVKSEETLQQLTDYTQITSYNLKSRMFPLEGIWIPAFTGMVGLKIHGPTQLVNLVHLLFRYGEYAGVGIKTAIGMGNIELMERKAEYDRQ